MLRAGPNRDTQTPKESYRTTQAAAQRARRFTHPQDVSTLRFSVILPCMRLVGGSSRSDRPLCGRKAWVTMDAPSQVRMKEATRAISSTLILKLPFFEPDTPSNSLFRVQ